MSQTISRLRFYSIGIVAANKPLDSMDIEVTAVEDTPMLHGEITDNIEKYSAKGQGANNDAFQVEAKTTASLKATWTPIGNPNRRTAPDVRRGEKVILYQFGDADKYWWSTLENDAKLRRLETIVWGVSNNSKENVQDDANSMYWLEVSTHKKLIHVQTTKSDGEKFAYTFQINAKEGSLTIGDDAENYITIDSGEKLIKLHNTDGTFIELRGKSIRMNASEGVHTDAKDISTQSETSTITASGSTSINSPSNAITGGTAITGMGNNGSGITFDKLVVNDLTAIDVKATKIHTPNTIDGPGFS